jgi:Ca2+/H+ antiporter, TMEM165/GDT1 family
MTLSFPSDRLSQCVSESSGQSVAEEGGDDRQSSPTSSPWQVFGSTFITILLAELGDKTQITTLLMSAESQRPWLVFLGAGSALITTSLLGVLVGRWLAHRVQPRTLNRAAGTVLVAIALTLLWDVVPTLLAP